MTVAPLSLSQQQQQQQQQHQSTTTSSSGVSGKEASAAWRVQGALMLAQVFFGLGAIVGALGLPQVLIVASFFVLLLYYKAS